jgi:hypothetical protein
MSGFDGADGIHAGLVFRMSPVAEVEAKYIRAGNEQFFDLFLTVARGPERGYDLGAPVAVHVPGYRAGGGPSLPEIRIARKSLTLVRVGPLP